MTIYRWDPFKDLLNLHEKINSLFDENGTPHPESVMSGSWAPAVDIYETESDVFVNAEIPGVDSESVGVKVRENVLIIKGERKFDKGLREENYHRIERNYGAFQRIFTLPVEVDHEKVHASFKDGVLEIILPKIPESKSKTIEITVA